MILKVRLPQEGDVEVDVEPHTDVARLKKALKDRTGCEPERHRMIYQGKILREEDTMEGLRVGDGHTMHLVLVPYQDRNVEGYVDDAEERGGSAHGMWSNRERPVSLWQLQHRGNESYHRHRLDEIVLELERFASEDEDETDSLDREAGVQREGGSTDLMLGLVLGIMLGLIAGLCLIERGLSQRMKLGILLGLAFNLSFAMLRFSTHKGFV